MGILNLLKEFGAASKSVHLCDFAGRSLAIDASCWLHRASFTCALELVRHQAECDTTNANSNAAAAAAASASSSSDLSSPAAASSPTPHPSRYLFWLRKMLRMLVHFRIKPIVVFDGAPLPAKSGTNASRDSLRALNRAKADKAFEEGRVEEASELYGKCLNISSAMVKNFQLLLQKEQIPFIIAPYEADAQIAHLYQSGAIYAAITEDSDLLPFGCHRILVKLDRDANAKLIDLTEFVKEEWSKKHFPVLHKIKRILMYDANNQRLPGAELTLPLLSPSFIHACVLSGCDYLPSLHGIGLKKSVNWIDEYPKLEQLFVQLKLQRKKLEDRWRKQAQSQSGNSQEAGDSDCEDVAAAGEDAVEASEAAAASSTLASRMSTQEYILHFHKAVLTFHHQLVFDPKSKAFKHLTPLSPQLQLLYEKSIKTEETETKDENEKRTECIDVEAETGASNNPPTDTSPSPPRVPTSTSSLIHSLSSSHPLLQVRDFSFLGPPIPPDLVEGFIAGKVDPKTMSSYSHHLQTQLIYDIDAYEERYRNLKREDRQQQQPPQSQKPNSGSKFPTGVSFGGGGGGGGSMRRGIFNSTGNATPAPSAPAANALTSFFARSTSSPFDAPTPPIASTPQKQSRSFSLSSHFFTPNTSNSVPSATGSTGKLKEAYAKREQQRDEDEMDDWFHDKADKAEADMEAEDALLPAEEKEITKVISSSSVVDSDTQQLDVEVEEAATAHNASVEEQPLSSRFTPPSQSTSIIAVSTDVSPRSKSLNPFIVPLTSDSSPSLSTGARLSMLKPFVNVTPLLKKHASMSVSSHTTPEHDVAYGSLVADRISTQPIEVCDLTSDHDEDINDEDEIVVDAGTPIRPQPSRSASHSAPASASSSSSSASAGMKRKPLIGSSSKSGSSQSASKRQKSVSAVQTPVSSHTLASFFQKSTSLPKSREPM